MPLQLRKFFTAILKPFFLAISTDQIPRYEKNVMIIRLTVCYLEKKKKTLTLKVSMQMFFLSKEKTSDCFGIGTSEGKKLKL
jgi:hypothetical protein